MKLKPIGDLIIVRPDPTVTKIGLIELAESAQEEAKSGIILAAGPGKQHESWFERQELEVGMKVLYSKFAKEHITHRGEELVVMHPADIVGVLDGSADR